MNTQEFFSALTGNDFTSFYGVPDSLLKNLCAYITDNVDPSHNIITANEGNAVAMACGYYLATSKFAVVYMQNSGLGNCVNPLLSLSDEEVYNIPFLMIIGLRGEPNTKDEPQHVKQGKITDKLLETMGIDYALLPKDIDSAAKALKDASAYMQKNKKPFAFLVQKNTFDDYILQKKRISNTEFSREEAICLVAEKLGKDDIVVATTGHISRELYEFRERSDQSHESDFLCVGSMGHASSLALAVANEKKERRVFCFDGDGACLMHMGTLSIIGAQKISNFKHIVFNNEAHDSVGGQPTATQSTCFTHVARACGYGNTYSVTNKDELLSTLDVFLAENTTSFLEIKVKCGARKNLGRPKEKPQVNKEMFIHHLGKK